MGWHRMPFVTRTESCVLLDEHRAIRVDFTCDGDFVTFQFCVDDKHVGHRRLHRADAMVVGWSVANSGAYDRLPSQLVLTSEQMRTFGHRLYAAGRNG